MLNGNHAPATWTNMCWFFYHHVNILQKLSIIIFVVISNLIIVINYHSITITNKLHQPPPIHHSQSSNPPQNRSQSLTTTTVNGTHHDPRLLFVVVDQPPGPINSPVCPSHCCWQWQYQNGKFGLIKLVCPTLQHILKWFFLSKINIKLQNKKFITTNHIRNFIHIAFVLT